MAERRNARLRREYLYRKSLEGKEKEAYERKDKIRKALEAGKPVPTELRREAAALKDQIDLEDERTAAPKTHVDDEYASAGTRDPKVCITTSRDPSSRLKQFAAEVRLIFPNAVRINRGSTTTKDILEVAKSADFTDIIVVQETRGEPDALLVSHLPYGPTVHFSLSNAVLRHDIEGRGTVSEAYPHLIFNNFKSTLGTRIQAVLQNLFPVPKPESQRVITFSNDSDWIAFRHHTYQKGSQVAGAGAGKDEKGKPRAVKHDDVVLTEVGPRFELRPFKISLGTIDQTDAEVEWVLRPYMNTARKKDAL